jgi:hypothetical protein
MAADAENCVVTNGLRRDHGGDVRQLGNLNCVFSMLWALRLFLIPTFILQEMLNEICAINAELLRRRESLD